MRHGVCPHCDGRVVAEFRHGTYDWRPCGFWRVYCEDCDLWIRDTETHPNLPIVKPAGDDDV